MGISDCTFGVFYTKAWGISDPSRHRILFSAICSMTQSTEQNCILSASAYWKPCSFHLWIVHSFIPDPVLRAHYTIFSVAAYYYAQSFMLNQLLLSFSTSGAKLLILPLLIWCYLVLPFSYSFVSRSITEV